jgi:cytochrome P450
MEFVRSLRPAGDIVRVDLGTWPVYFLTTPELVHQVRVAQARSFARGAVFERARPLLGSGLATSDGDLHHRQRRLMQPAFQHSRIAAYAETMSRSARAMTDSWRAGDVVALNDEMYSLALTIVAEAMFSAAAGRPAVAAVRRLMPVLVRGILVRTVAPPLLVRAPTPGNRRFHRVAEQLRGAIDQVVQRYRASATDHADLLSMLLAARDADTGEAMTDLQVRDEVVTVMLTGTETTATTLSWALHELARHPEVEERVHREVDAVIGTRPPGHADVARLEHTGRVLDETLRLHPALLFMRRAVAPVEIGGTAIPAGTEIAYSPYALQRDPDLYPFPDRFDPDRWLPDRVPRRLRSAFTPFGAGPHRCIGDAFAWSEMAIALATIAARWRLRPLRGHAVREVRAAIPRPSAVPMEVQPRPAT